MPNDNLAPASVPFELRGQRFQIEEPSVEAALQFQRMTEALKAQGYRLDPDEEVDAEIGWGKPMPDSLQTQLLFDAFHGLAADGSEAFAAAYPDPTSLRRAVRGRAAREAVGAAFQALMALMTDSGEAPAAPAEAPAAGDGERRFPAGAVAEGGPAPA